METLKPKIYSYTRFSSKEQLTGDSQRRQDEYIDKYKNQSNLEFDTELDLKDRGVSAFNAMNIEKGTLGKFLKLIKEGKIAKGSVLLIENIDRLSRLRPTDAYDVFMGIIKAEIKIVTLHNGIEFTEKSVNSGDGQLYILIGEIQRAHRESKVKSERLKAAWENNRERARKGEYIFTGRYPEWLALSEDKKSFKLIIERCNAIEQIYRLKLNGFGAEKIAKIMNKDTSVWGPPRKEIKSRKGEFKLGGWRASYINKILYNNRSLLGEFQPHKLVEGKREPDGEPIKNYYPSALSEELFYEVQDLIKANSKLNGNAGGKTGKKGNLFTHIIKCGLCGSSMIFVDKGEKKATKYLHCDSSRRKLKNGIYCQARPIRYDDFKELFFDTIYEFDIDNIIPQEEEQAVKINSLKRELDLVLSQIEQLKKEQKNILNSIKSFDIEGKTPLRILTNELENLDNADAELLDRRKALTKEIEEAEVQREQIIKNIDHTKEVYQLLASTKDEEELIKIRGQLIKEIRRIVDKIDIIPFLNKNEEYKRIKPKYDEYMKTRKEPPSTARKRTMRVNPYIDTLRRIEEEKTNHLIFGGTARIFFTSAKESKKTILRLKTRDKHFFERI